MPIAAAAVCCVLAVPAAVTSASRAQPHRASAPVRRRSGRAPRRRPRSPAASAARVRRLAIAVRGDRLVDGAGRTVVLHGVNRSGSQYMCVLGRGVFDGPADTTSVAAISSWHVNAVRVPVNEDCWLAINGVRGAYAGVPYRAAVERYIAELNDAGIYAIIDVHWSAPGQRLATGQQTMLDANHGYTLWRSIARAFRHDPGVMFDLYNEPHNLAGTPARAWRCWQDGCDGHAGMGGLVRAVRATGARNVILLAGLDWGNDESRWLTHEPADPDRQLAVAFHVYRGHGGCSTETCWARTLPVLAAHVPVVADEFGEMQCGEPEALRWLEGWMSFAQTDGISMLAWSWNTGGEACAPPRLIAAYDGTPTVYGAAVEALYAAGVPARTSHRHLTR